ncbi:transmembrane 9-like isoform X3 [Brachionus plicatilis]|uniref:Transmembrane 9-like isoform X3 n=1 Tax=Brachionus plicatilis TaxID=10195 RepID=A0A3M7QY50_BRAPC|nr:transmembrane 9-like isoform X3 [Brachionus plicatilis]
MRRFVSLLVIVLFCSLEYTYAADEFYDFRCICVCPSFTVINQTETNRKIYIDVIPKDRCTCENVLSKWKPNQTEMLKQFCPRCNCNYEVRNTTTMKIVVIIIICILALLFIYMGFLLCLDPWMNRRTRLYQEQQNEELSLESDEQPFAQIPNTSTRSNVINRMSKEQSKWKRQVQEQRRTVYDRHVLLN